MKTLKIAIALIAVIGLATFVVGLALAHFTNTPYNYNTAVSEAQTGDWWTQMREYMESRWNGIEDEEWYDDMAEYMQEHWNEVQNQAWFNQMLQYMQEHGYQPYGYQHYGYNGYDNYYYGSRGCGRGFGCMGW